MANLEHLEVLQQGVKTWNDWRSKNPDLKPDLNSANLNGLDLDGVNFSKCNLISTNLSFANLSHAKMIQSDLSHARLVGANLDSADISFSDLSCAILREIDLSHAELIDSNLECVDLSDALLSHSTLSSSLLNGACLVGVDFQEATIMYSELYDISLEGSDLGFASFRYCDLGEADLFGCLLHEAEFKACSLKGADLSRSVMLKTSFVASDLSQVVGLGSCTHQGRSNIDIYTLEKSKDLPDAFLKGIGMSEQYRRNYSHGTEIMVEFAEKIWGDLIPISKALRATLGTGYEIVKNQDRISVRLSSPQLLNQTLDAIGAVFSALESESSGDISSLEIRSLGNEDEVLRHQDLMFLLSRLSERYDVHNAPKSFIEATAKGLVNTFENIPLGPLLIEWIEWIHAKVQKPDKDEQLLQEIYKRYKSGFRSLTEIRSLPDKEIKLLPVQDD